MEEKKKMNLKIIIPIIIAIVVVAIVGIVVMTNNKMSKEKMMEKAQELNLREFEENIKENKINAQEKYTGNIYIISGFVKSIGEDNIILNYYGSRVKVYLSKDEIKSLENNKRIDIVGKMNDVDYITEENNSDEIISIWGTTTSSTEKVAVGTMKKAYLLENYGMKKEEMLKVAQIFDGKQVKREMEINEQTTKDKYMNKICVLDCTIDKIGKNYIEVRNEGSITNLRIYLKEDDLKSLVNNTKITVVGKISNISHYSGDAVGGSFDLTMEQAYILTKEERQLLENTVDDSSNVT